MNGLRIVASKSVSLIVFNGGFIRTINIRWLEYVKIIINKSDLRNAVLLVLAVSHINKMSQVNVDNINFRRFAKCRKSCLSVLTLMTLMLMLKFLWFIYFVLIQFWRIDQRSKLTYFIIPVDSNVETFIKAVYTITLLLSFTITMWKLTTSIGICDN